MALFVPPSALIDKNRHDLTLAGFADLHRNGLHLGSLSNDARSDCTDTNRCTSDDQVHNPRSHTLQPTSPMGRLARRPTLSVCPQRRGHFSVHNRNLSHIRHLHVGLLLERLHLTKLRPRQRSTTSARHFRGPVGTSPGRWPQPLGGEFQRWFRRSCIGSRTTACPECRRLLDLCHGLKRPHDRPPRWVDSS